MEETEFYKAWKALPKSKREKLTKRQLARVCEESTLFDVVQLELQVKESKKRGLLTQQTVQPMKSSRTYDDTYIQKHKPKKIIEERLDLETNQIVKTMVDKAKKTKITPMKKAILQKRQKVALEKENLEEVEELQESESETENH